MTRLSAPGVVAILSLVALSISGCGDGGSDGERDAGAGASDASSVPSTGISDSSEPPSESPTEQATVAGAADEAIAEASLLTLQDFPVGWESSPADDTEDTESQRKIAQCLGVGYDELYGDQFAEVESPDFTSEDDEEVSNSVSVAADEAQTIRAFEIASQPKFRECVLDGLADNVEESSDEVEVGDITFNELSFPSSGDDTLAFRATIPLTAGGASFEARADFVLVRVGRARTFVTSFGVGSTLPAEALTQYVEIAVQRLTRVLERG